MSDDGEIVEGEAAKSKLVVLGTRRIGVAGR